MKKFVLAALVWLIFCGSILQPPLLAEINIPITNIVKNEPPGYCVWTSLESVAKFEHIPALYGLVEQRKKDPPFILPNGTKIPAHFGGADSVEQKLRSLHVKFEIYEDVINRDTSLITRSLKKNLPVIVGLNGAYCPTVNNEDAQHAVICVELTKDHMVYLDTNRITSSFDMSRKMFDEAYLGLAIVILPEK